MYVTEQLIKLIESEEILEENVSYVALGNKSLEDRAKEIKEVLTSLADEEATPWLSWSVASIVFEMVNWEAIASHFERRHDK